MNIRACLALATIGCTCVAAALTARTSSQATSQTFQLVSVRRSPQPPCPAAFSCFGSSGQTASRPTIELLPEGRFEARGQSLEDLARVAYRFELLDPRRGVVDASRPYGLARDRFDITAAAEHPWSAPPPGDSVPSELRPMLRALLEDRFALKAHVQTRKVDVYALKLARREGPPGPGLVPSTSDCLGPYTAPPRNDPDARLRCAFTLELNRVEAGAVTMPEVARIVSRIEGLQADRVIVNQTGLMGRYDMALSLTTIDVRTRRSIPQQDVSETGSAAPQGTSWLADRRAIAIREALEQQLGLKLTKAKLLIPTLIIERARAPRED